MSDINNVSDTVKSLLYLYCKARKVVFLENKPARVAKRLWIYWDQDKVLADYKRPAFEQLVVVCTEIREELANEA